MILFFILIAKLDNQWKVNQTLGERNMELKKELEIAENNLAATQNSGLANLEQMKKKYEDLLKTYTEDSKIMLKKVNMLKNELMFSISYSKVSFYRSRMRRRSVATIQVLIRMSKNLSDSQLLLETICHFLIKMVILYINVIVIIPILIISFHS